MFTHWPPVETEKFTTDVNGEWSRLGGEWVLYIHCNLLDFNDGLGLGVRQCEHQSGSGP